MAKVRVFAFLSTLVIVVIAGVFLSYYARGYKLNLKTFQFQPNGILVIKSEPDGASVYVDNELKGATNTSLSLHPGNYDIEVRKDGFFTWYKRMTIEKEVVDQATISLFKNAPSLSPITFSGAKNPIISRDGAKIAYADKNGIYTLDTYYLPLGFSYSPKKVTDIDPTNATFSFSKDGRQILLTTSQGIFLLDSGSFTPQNQLVNISTKKDTILDTWNKEKQAKELVLVQNLPPQLTEILERRSSDFTFSPDENMILYTASSTGTLNDNLIPQLPGASTQKQERNIQIDHTYVYDIKEDRNFLVGNSSQTIRWMSTSKQVMLADTNQVVIMDYDGTNKQVVFSGSYVAPNAFPYQNATKILILTNLGSTDTSSTNLYSVTIK